jgi:probable rRNA maturation factor
MLSQPDVRRLRNVFGHVAEGVAGDADLQVGEIRFLIVDERQIIKLHGQFFNDRSSTDVITFPASHDPDQPIEGDVAICFQVACRQARTAGHSVLREIAFLGVHAILHLGGWTDDTPAERAAMLRHQESVLLEFERTSGQL